MAVFSIEIADADVPRVIGAVCANYGRPETVPNPSFDPEQEESEANPTTVANPEDTFQFTNRIVRQFLAEHVSAYEVNQAKSAAAAAVDSSVTISDPLV
jgi:hypothetical protein